MRYPKHQPDHPTTCDTSDLLNEIAKFVENEPNWHESGELCAKLAVALQILRIACPDPSSCTDDEYEFVMNICQTLNEARP
jgi:hypothetical protein